MGHSAGPMECMHWVPLAVLRVSLAMLPFPSWPPSDTPGALPWLSHPTPGSVGYSHHGWMAAEAAGGVGRSDESAWDRTAHVAEAAVGGDVVCGDRETALVRPHIVAEALPGAPRGLTITCAASPRHTPWKPGDHPLSALPMDMRIPSMGMGLSPREG